VRVCVNCKHHIGPKDGIWYEHYCGAVERDRVTDPVTGKSCYGGVNDLGTVYTTDERFRNCREINKAGDCQFYEFVGRANAEKRGSLK